MAFSMLKIRRPLGRLIFNMGIAIPGKTVFLIETAPRMKFNICLLHWALADAVVVWNYSRWRHQMETFSALLALCAGEFPSQRPVTRNFDVSLICALNKRLSKQPWGWWFEMPPRSSCRTLEHICIIYGLLWDVLLTHILISTTVWLNCR